MPPVAIIDQPFCERVCIAASALGWGLREIKRQGRHCFVWCAPDGKSHRGPFADSRTAALTRACELFRDLN